MTGVTKTAMRRIAGVMSLIVIAACLSNCAAPPSPQTAPALPPAIGNGVGSALGNYAGQIGGDATGPAGQHCVVFNWDRPLNKDFAIRYASLSCDQQTKDWKTTTTYSRTVIPIAQSNLGKPDD